LNRTISWSCSLTKKCSVLAMRYIISRVLSECEVKTPIYSVLDQRFWSVGPASSGLATIAVISPGPGRLSRPHFPRPISLFLTLSRLFPPGLLELRSPPKGDFRAYFPAFANRINLALSGLTGQTGLRTAPSSLLKLARTMAQRKLSRSRRLSHGPVICRRSWSWKVRSDRRCAEQYRGTHPHSCIP
jgi:hypothetical protein